MNISFRVFSTLTGNDLTDKECWVLSSDGRLLYKHGDSLYEDESLKAVFDLVEEDNDGKQLRQQWILYSE